MPLRHSSVGRALVCILIALTLTCLLLVPLLLGLLPLLVPLLLGLLTLRVTLLLVLLWIAGSGVAVGGSRIELSFLLLDFSALLLCKQGTVH